MYSWEVPIEESILKHVQHMKNQMERQVAERNDKFLWIDLDKNIRKGAAIYADAYGTMERYILRELKLRSRIKKEIK